MPDPFRHINVGDPIPRSASAWNAMLDAGRAELTRKLDAGAGPSASRRDACIVRVKNNTGTDLTGRSVLGLDGPVFTPTDSETAFLREVCFRGVTPTLADHAGKFAVLIEPAKPDQVVLAYVAGVCPVRVDVLDPDDDFADVDDGQTGRLVSARDGAAQILWKESDDGYYGYDTGEQWAIVRVGNRRPRCFAQVDGSGIGVRVGSQLGAGIATLWKIDADGVLTTTGVDLPVFNASVEKDVAGDAWVQLKYSDGRALVDWADCGDLADPGYY